MCHVKLSLKGNFKEFEVVISMYCLHPLYFFNTKRERNLRRSERKCHTIEEGNRAPPRAPAFMCHSRSRPVLSRYSFCAFSFRRKKREEKEGFEQFVMLISPGNLNTSPLICLIILFIDFFVFVFPFVFSYRG